MPDVSGTHLKSGEPLDRVRLVVVIPALGRVLPAAVIQAVVIRALIVAVAARAAEVQVAEARVQVGKEG